MAVLDRLWHWQFAWACLLALLAGAFAFWYLRALLPLERAVGMPLLPDALIAADLVGALLCLAGDALIVALRARRREALRASAITGNQEAIPPAPISADPLTPEEARAPTEAIARGSGRAMLGDAWDALLFFGGAVFMGAISVRPVGTLLATVSHPGLASLSAQQLSWLFSGFAAVFGSALFLLTIVPPDIVAARYHPSRITVTREGLTRVGPWGREDVLRWPDAALLEVERHYKRNLRYTLYGRSGQRLRWQHPREPAWMEPLNFARIAPAVSAHTGLLPRGFSRWPIEPVSQRNYVLLGLLFQSPRAAIAAVSVAIWFLAISITDTTVRPVLAVYLALCGLALLIDVVNFLRWRRAV